MPSSRRLKAGVSQENGTKFNTYDALAFAAATSVGVVFLVVYQYQVGEFPRF